MFLAQCPDRGKDGKKDGRTYGRMDGRMERPYFIAPFRLPLGVQLKGKNKIKSGIMTQREVCVTRCSWQACNHRRLISCFLLITRVIYRPSLFKLGMCGCMRVQSHTIPVQA